MTKGKVMATYAVIQIGGKQHIVTKGDTLKVELATDENTLNIEPLAVFDDKNTTIGTPTVSGGKVKIEVGDTVKGEKVTSIKFESKKRVKTVRGHRQLLRNVVIADIKAS